MINSVIAIDNTVEGAETIFDNLTAELHIYLVRFISAFKLLAFAKSLTCAASGVEFPAVTAPTMVVIDVRCLLLQYIVYVVLTYVVYSPNSSWAKLWKPSTT